MKMKRLLLCLIHLMGVTLLHATDLEGQQQGPLAAVATTTLNDTTADKEDVVAANATAKAGSAKTKAGFKDLFVSQDLSDQNYLQAELNPLAISFVEDYMEKHSSDLNKMKGWGKPYFDMIDEIFSRYDIPHEMKYLAVIESNLRASTVSWAGAVGPWQFIPSTARLMGLKVNGKTDERTNYVKSTHAAAKYIKKLYNELGDWLLVVAAYNSGPSRVTSAIRRSGSENFWKLQYHLPLESRNHVKKFIATHYIMEGKGGLTTLTKKETEELEKAGELKGRLAAKVDNTRVQQVSGKYNSTVVAKVLEMELTAFNELNPGFDKFIAEGKAYMMNLPEDKMDKFNAHKYQILSESVEMMMQRVSVK